METRASYSVEMKLKAIEMQFAKVPVKEVMEELSIQTIRSRRHECGGIEMEITYDNNIRIQTKLNSQSPVQYRQLAA
ncbi:hypothetical protein MHH81_21205 [Psychrobacillus sp. FSL H8-0484]|uniref:hypothetical protein n=1 Tax=Psychrobacillus sp. FSL H8-0484 TaxID=2921390 RepID=UPI0030FA1561